MARQEIDAVVRMLLETARHDLIAWLTGTCPDEVEPLPTDLVDTDVRIADRIFRATLPGPPPARHHFHVEVQTAGKAGMGLRMLRYWSKAKEALLREEEEPRISSVVIYLDRGQYRPDPGEYRADEGFGTTCAFGYRVVRLWDVDPAEILAFADPGLAPLLPLTRHDDPLRAVIESKEKIVGACPDLASQGRKAELCAALVVLGGLVIGDGDLVWNMIREDWMGLERSSTVQYLLAKGMEKGIAKSIVAVLESRFGQVDPKIQARIFGIEDREVLERLLPIAATSPGIEAIVRELGPGGEMR